jgi:aromatic-L-amino-acid decarboxylase
MAHDGADPADHDEPRVRHAVSATVSLDEVQQRGLGDMESAAFRAAAHRVVDLMADYLEGVADRPVLRRFDPAALRAALAGGPPERPEPLANILADYQRLIEPNATHWQHPGFFAFFPTTASGPGILGEMLTAAIAQNPMLWRASPAGTALEEVVVGWLRDALGLPPDLDGLLTDTASTSTLIALGAAREMGGLDAAARGLAGRPEIGLPVVYASAEAHSSIDKACMTLGLGRAGLVRVPVDDRFQLSLPALEAAIAADRAAGRHPIAIVATIGTTSSTSVDPVAAVADVAARDGLWLHVDAAYAGAAAILPERRRPFEGWERADSIVVNPHKWLFAPLDASLLLTRRMADLQRAFSVVPEYLRDPGTTTAGGARDYSDYTPQLGRRFRALKLWLEIRWFGLDGLRRRIRHHLQLADELRTWVDADPDWQRLAPVPFSTVCLAFRPHAQAGREGEPAIRDELDARNAAILEAVNATGEVFLSHTRLGNRFTIRVAIGNLHSERRHVARAWELLRREAAALGG